MTLASEGKRRNGRWERGSVPVNGRSPNMEGATWQDAMKRAGVVLDHHLAAWGQTESDSDPLSDRNIRMTGRRAAKATGFSEDTLKKVEEVREAADRNLSTGARAILAEQARRLTGNTKSGVSQVLGIHQNRVIEAGLVLDWAGDHAQKVIAGTMVLSVAVDALPLLEEEARKRQAAAAQEAASSQPRSPEGRFARRVANLPPTGDHKARDDAAELVNVSPREAG